MENKKAKLRELDYLRAIAFLAVVFQHVWGIYARNSTSTTDQVIIGLSFTLAKFAVPLFVFLSGVVMFYNYYGKLNYFQFLKKRIIEIIIPYVLWTMYYLGEWRPIQEFTTWNWWKNLIASLLIGSGKYHLWYIVMIFQLMLLLPLIFWLYQRIHAITKTLKGGIIVIGSLVGAYWLWITYYHALFCNTPFTRVNFWMSKIFSIQLMSYFIYIVLGALCAMYYQTFVSFITRYFKIITLLMIINYIYIEWEAFKNSFDQGKIDLAGFSSHNTRYMFFSILSILFLYRCALWIVYKNPTKKHPLIQVISDYSFHAYLGHALGLKVALIVLKDFSGDKNLLLYIGVFMIGTLISIAIGIISYHFYQWILQQFTKTEAIHKGIRIGEHYSQRHIALKLKAEGMSYEKIKDITGIDLYELEK